MLAVLLALATAAHAAKTTALTAVNVRSGPGINFALLGNLVAGQSVDVIQCQNNWCLIDSVGPDGWVSAEYLASVGDVDSSRGAMLYFEIRYQGKPVDPAPWFR